MVINGNECGTNERGHWVYFGYSRKGNLVYIGTTIQRPEDRFRWHKSNGKPLRFVVQHNYATTDEMLDAEIHLINKHKPALNKKTKRHNDNRKLKEGVKESRVGVTGWCQACLKRRVNKGYTKCYWCG
ncbi:GIY-YIG nuclease family protein (plasmid) [Halobacteriovorax sp. GFR7]|uniref:GIY-YIG nuclease family protein n=1 Tax=unclassified Halobacteriovorax TaxID=2639665 RepID=UPI003D98AE04